ncbi:MAG: TIGR02099 family protein [Proteobacteria bacterium]|nr:TIGR02099 family protein [Pseudomonadota bacterium]MCL2307801.1 TIGR02099 family protein [Pseudomonadota bacterium]
MKPRHFFILFRFLRFLKVVLITAAALVALFVTALLVIRFVLLPQWEAQPQKVADFFGEMVGLPVALGSLKTGWDGWNPQLIVHDLQIYTATGGATTEATVENIDAADADAQLTLPEVGLQVDAWSSLLHFDLRFQRLRLEQPTLIVRRDAAGRVFVGGVLLTATPEDEEDGSGAFVDWLLRQRAIEISGGTVEWRDEKRAAPPLVIAQMDFRGEQGLSHYRFGVRGDLVSETGATFEVRGETMTGLLLRSFDRDWQGYARLNRVDLGSLRQWIDLPMDVTRGEGNVQAWASLSKQRVTSVTVDIALHDVKANLAAGVKTEVATVAEPAVAPLELQEVRGRFNGREGRGRFVFSTEGLTFVEKSGLRLEPMKATLTLEGFNPATPPQVTELLAKAPRGRLEFDRLDVSVLAGLLQSIPLPEGWRTTLAGLNIRGMLENGEGGWEFARGEFSRGEFANEENGTEDSLQLLHYNARATVRRASVQAYGAYPGVRGIGGTVSFDEKQGTVILSGRDVVLDLPKVFPDAISLDTADGNVRWTHKPEGVLVQIDALRFSNADAEGTLKGTWQANGSAGIADLTAQLQRAAASRAHRYIPHVAGDDVRDWLRESLKSGSADHARMVLKGDLHHFPFYGGKHGSFVVDAHAADVRMVYDPAWPAIDGIDADLRFENERMTITAKRGAIFDAALGKTQAVIPDLGADHPHLLVEGSASGSATTYLRFLDESPVGGWIDHMLSGTRATGNGVLTLKLDIPLDGEAPSKVNGTFTLVGNTLDIPGVPLLTQAQGAVAFTENDIKADALKFEAFGGSGTVTLTSRNGGLVLTGTGTADLSTLRANTSLPLLDRLSGTTPWRLTLNTSGSHRGLYWALTTPLTGVAVELPEPLGKTAEVAALLRIAHDTLTVAAAEKEAGKESGKEAKKEEHWRIDYQSPGGPLTVVAKRVPDGATWKLERVLLNVGEGSAGAALPTTPGLSVRGSLARLNIDPWHALYQALPPNKETDVLTLGDVDVNIGTLNVLGRLLHEVKFSARKGVDIHGINLVSREAEGRMTWEDAAAGTVNGRLRGDFARLTLLETGELSSWDARFSDGKSGDGKSDGERKTSATLIPGSANPWPEIDFKVDRFFYKERNLGHLSLQAEPRGTDWHMKNVVLSNPGGTVMVNGWWRTARQEQRTEINLEMQVNDAENFLEHFGVPKSVMASDVRLGGALSWGGAPNDFDFGALDGYLTLHVGRGRFTKIEPGIGRLLGVLSLQALPRRLTLDFRDVFSEGFAFDSITGTTEIDDGVLHTSDLLMNGASAKVKLTGTVDLGKETQDLNVYVQPSLTDSLSVGAAGASVLLMANPVGAAAVGVGALVGQMILGNPFEKLFSYEYTVKGSWDDPTVEKKTREGLRPPPAETLTPGEAERTR